MADELIVVEKSDPRIAVVTLNRPAKRNALSLALIEQLRGAATELAKEPGRRVLILRGNGPAFCAGLDLSEAGDTDLHARSAEALAGMYETIGSCPLVTIACPRGAAMGGGAGLLAACDFVVATDDLRLGYPEVRRGLVAALVTCLLRRQLSDRAVRELILRGQTIDAPHALSMGLISSIAPAAELDRAGWKWGEDICQGAPGAIARTKQLLDDLAARPLHDDLQRALAHHQAARQSAEATEGMAAFREKRQPRWQ